MPISEKIAKRIKSAKASKAEKELMTEILEIEDKGSFRYQVDYEKKINEFIKKYPEEVKE